METIEIAMLNKGVTPFIPEKGSLGASGDLAPLSHMVLPMIGLGMAWYKGELLPGAEAMERAGIPVIELSAKEGLALNNGTQAMTSVGAHALHDAITLLKTADIAAALSFEAQNGVVDALDAKFHQVRPPLQANGHGQELIKASGGKQERQPPGRDPRTGRLFLALLPAVHGASKDAVDSVGGRVDIEINAVTDNPLIFREDRSGISRGKFHGQPMALSFDFLKIAESELADVSERRIERLVNPAYSGLPAFLTPNGGVNSGFMIVQYSAAALVSENKVLAHPASVDSIPSSAGQEDHVRHGDHRRKAGRRDRPQCAPCAGYGADGSLPGHRHERK